MHYLPFSTPTSIPVALPPLLRTPIRSPLLLHFPSTRLLPRIPAATARRRFEFLDADSDSDSDSDDEEEEVGRGGSAGRERGADGADYNKDPELAKMLGNFMDDPKKARDWVEERIRKKKSTLLQEKTGSSKLMNVIFRKFDFSDSFIWFEFYVPLLPKDISLICDVLRAWYIIGHLGGCNPINLQLHTAPLESKRLSYDHIEGANVTPTTFYNIGDLEVQENVARVWVDIGTEDMLILDVLINALVNISSDYIGIKQVVFGGSLYENWKEGLTTEDEGFSVHKI